MAKIENITVAVAFVACAVNAPLNNAYGADSGNKAAPAAALGDALLARELSSYEAWKSRDGKFWDSFLSDKFVGYGSSGRLDKASATREYTGASCAIKSYSLSDARTRPLGKGVALVTYKNTIDGTCDGQKVPATGWAASVYVRDGGRWKGAFHAESPIVDPAAAGAKPVASNQAPEAHDANPAAVDAHTEGLLAAERAVWEAWRVHDGKKIGTLTGKDIAFINIFGTYLANRDDALRNWSGTGCDVKSISFTHAAGTMLSPTIGILTFTAAADGTCYGQAVGQVWGSSIYVKNGNAWTWVFGINTPAHP
jgi:Domain of unknown function (DUF4440)